MFPKICDKKCMSTRSNEYHLLYSSQLMKTQVYTSKLSRPGFTKPVVLIIKMMPIELILLLVRINIFQWWHRSGMVLKNALLMRIIVTLCYVEIGIGGYHAFLLTEWNRF